MKQTITSAMFLINLAILPFIAIFQEFLKQSIFKRPIFLKFDVILQNRLWPKQWFERWLVKYVQLCVNRRVNPSFHNGDHLQWLNYERRERKREKQQVRQASYQFQGTWRALALDLVILTKSEQWGVLLRSCHYGSPDLRTKYPLPFNFDY